MPGDGLRFPGIEDNFEFKGRNGGLNSRYHGFLSHLSHLNSYFLKGFLTRRAFLSLHLNSLLTPSNNQRNKKKILLVWSDRYSQS